MPSATKQIQELFQKLTANNCSAQELHTFFELLHQQSEQEQPLIEAMDSYWDDVSSIKPDAIKGIRMKEEITAAIVKQNRPAAIPFIRRWRWAAAAILILAIGSGVYYFNNQSSKLPTNIGGTGGTMVTGGDIAPGTNRAVLTIDSNQNIDLASDKTGINIDNTITYNDGEKIASTGQMLQLTTPRGGQYQAVLPDGSKVWLNAASSIKFPSKFSDKERKVSITGEAYFEIAKDASKPFKVNADGQEIEVLGTAFNINAYNDEPFKASLAEGAIKINQLILKPGQAYTKGKIVTTKIEEDLAWKNGRFNFEGKTVEEVMKQLSRWYNIEIKYEAPPPNIEFLGELRRDVNLSNILLVLKSANLPFRMEGDSTLVIMADK